MQGWTRNITNSTHDELRRLRKEIARGGAAPLRVIIAGDPSKPLLSFTIPRRAPALLAVAAVVWVFVVPFARSRSASGSALLSLAGAPPKVLDPASSIRSDEAEDRRQRTVFLEGVTDVGPGVGQQAVPETTPPREPVQAAASNGQLGSSDGVGQKWAATGAASTTPPSNAPPESVELTLEIVNTGKIIHLKLVGPTHEPDERSYRLLRHELRCQRSGAEHPIDPRLTELLYRISAHTSERVQVVSAYRAPVQPGEFNFHARGMAADIRVPGMSPAEVRDLAQSLGARGIGYYPTVQFVHVDVRDLPFSWTDTSGHGDLPPRYESPGVAEPTASAPIATGAGAASASPSGSTLPWASPTTSGAGAVSGLPLGAPLLNGVTGAPPALSASRPWQDRAAATNGAPDARATAGSGTQPRMRPEP